MLKMHWTYTTIVCTMRHSDSQCLNGTSRCLPPKSMSQLTLYHLESCPAVAPWVLYIWIKCLRQTCKLPCSFSTLIHSNVPLDLSQMMYLRGVSSNIAAHLVSIKADLNYFLDKIQDLQPDIQGVTLLCIERLRYIVLVLSPLLLVNTESYRSLCEGNGSHPQHLCPHCHYHILLHSKLTSGLDMTLSFSCTPSDESDDGGASCSEIRLSWASMHKKYDRFSKIIHELYGAYSILTQALAFC